MQVLYTDLAGLERGEADACGEIWLAEPQCCLWRATQVPSHEMMSEGTHEQNLRRIYVRSGPMANNADIERALRRRVHESGREGEFVPLASTQQS